MLTIAIFQQLLQLKKDIFI